LSKFYIHLKPDPNIICVHICLISDLYSYLNSDLCPFIYGFIFKSIFVFVPKKTKWIWIWVLNNIRFHPKTMTHPLVKEWIGAGYFFQRKNDRYYVNSSRWIKMNKSDLLTNIHPSFYYILSPMINLICSKFIWLLSCHLN
jgi:hypothetical protein